MNRTSDWWDRWFVGLARYVASASKDPSTQTGAVVVDGRRRVVSVGYNGFARGVSDDPARYADRNAKYKMIVHCERNAILFAGRDLTGCTLYTWPFLSCAPCAAVVIQSGISRVCAPVLPSVLAARWGADLDLAKVMFGEAGVEVCELEDDRG